MPRIINKRVLLILTLLVGVLPFGLGYGLTTLLDDSHAASQTHTSPMGCAEMTHADACEAMLNDSPWHDDCCSDHCDTSPGSQLCAGSDYSLELPSGHLFQSASSAWVSGPVPPTLLRPPQPHT